MSSSRHPETPLERIRSALEEWLDAFDAESAALVRAELAQISETDAPSVILGRLESALHVLDDEAARLHARGEAEREKSMTLERKAMEFIRAGDDNAARDALAEQTAHQELATQHFDQALQLNWVLTKFRTAAATMRERDGEGASQA